MSIEDDVNNAPDGDEEHTDVELNDDQKDAVATNEDTGKADKPDEAAASDKDDDDPEPKPKKVGGWEKRVNKLTKRNARALQENEDLRQENERLRTAAESDNTGTTEKPKEEDFDTHSEYVEALTDWKIDQRDAARDKKTSAAKQESQRLAERAENEANFTELAGDFVKEHDDFDEVCFDEDLPITGVMSDAIMSSELGPNILYHLGMNPKEAKRIANLSPISQVREIGKVEAKLGKPTKNTRTNAPKPVKPVGSNNDKDSNAISEKDDMKTFIEKRNKKIYGS